MKPITLGAGAYRAVVAPALGGSLLALTYQGWDVLRPASADIDDPRMAACFPMVPFCNRIGRGVLIYRDRSVTLPPNARGIDDPAHGYGWLRPWRVRAIDDDSVTLVHDSVGTPWPWAYVATQVISLSEGGLVIELSLTNQAAEAAPVGLGLHPYFSARTLRGIRLDGQVAEGNAVEALNVCHEPWLGRAEIAYSQRRLTLQAQGASRLQIFRPVKADFLCLEPVMNRAVTDDLHAAGLEGLGSGETRRIRMRIEVI